MKAFEKAEAGAEYVVTRFCHSNVNLRTQLHKIIKRAGLKPWPKAFQNLRSTRQTELAERWPAHVVCAWLGNSRKVAHEHYLQVTEEHFERAVQSAAQNPAQYPTVSGCTVRNATPEDDLENADLQGVTAPCEATQDILVGRAGFEPA